MLDLVQSGTCLIRSQDVLKQTKNTQNKQTNKQKITKQVKGYTLKSHLPARQCVVLQRRESESESQLDEYW